MPEVYVDDTNFELYKQCEIRMPSKRGYYYDIIWIKADLVRKGNHIVDEEGYKWVIHEVYGSKKLPGGRMNLKAVI